MIENLRHFKALAETGEIPRTQGQPHEDRGMIGMKASIGAFGAAVGRAAGLQPAVPLVRWARHRCASGHR
jgi:hypothetical protein